MGDFKKIERKFRQGLSGAGRMFKKYGEYAIPFYGQTKMGFDAAQGQMPGTDYENKQAAKNEEEARAAAEAQARQREFEASQKAGFEALAQRRRKGFGSSIVVRPSLGSSTTLGS